MKQTFKMNFKPVALMVTLLFSQISVAQAFDDNSVLSNDNHTKHQYEMKQRGHGKQLRKMAKALDLTDFQKEQIKAIKLSAKEQNQELQASLKQMKAEQKALIHADVFDEHAFTALFNAYQPTAAQWALGKAKTKHAIYSVLTAEQKEKWQKIKQNNKRGRK